MKNSPLALLLILGALSIPSATAVASQKTTVKEYEKEFTTYPYSDPDPVPAMSRYYPYFRYDGFTDKPVRKKWKVVELSNDYIQLLILPEIGGKVWAAIEKKTGRPFLYYNHVVKFRDVSMRGPWTSGGMEANYGIIGHTPNCFSPVDYTTRRNPDGGASCIIGTLDLLTRTEWRLEINLPADQACFSTRSFWHNGSGAEQPYYTWMNIGIKAAGNLEFIHAGNHYLGHDGKAFAWPVNPENGHEISWYDKNDFGPYKSYHVFGKLSEFFGGYYHDDDFGMAHFAPYGDKPGRKVWIWGLSRQGMIWEKLLTDTDGQYVEVQSGRLFNQTADESSVTPFKHREFPPYATDTWTEYWEPVKGTGGFVSASPWGAMNVTSSNNQLVIRISPAGPLRDNLEVFDGTNRLWSREVSLKPMETIEKTVALAAPPKALRVSLGGGKLEYDAAADETLSRPVESPADFDWQSDYGFYQAGKENERERAYAAAQTNFVACLKVNPNYAPALVEMAALSNRKAEWASARKFSLHALSIDTYDPGANYNLGIASAALGNKADAKDAFSIAALSAGWRSAANTGLAMEFLREKRYDRALASADASLDSDRRNLDAFQIEACAARLSGDTAAAEKACQTLLELDPLNHFAQFESFLRGKISREEFVGQIRNELPGETYLELAAWYRNAGLTDDAARVLEIAPTSPEALYWLAFLRRDTNLLARAEAASPAFAFPFRAESIPVFEWARQNTASWQPRYYLALIRWYQGELQPARELLDGCGDQPPFAPFYAARAQVAPGNAPRDLEKAAQLDPSQWRYGSMLVKHFLAQTNFDDALKTASDYSRRFAGNNVLSLLEAKTLVLNGQYQTAAARLSSLDLIPCEGSTDARGVLREARLMLALDDMKSGNYDAALQQISKAREWPENLGAGKPYDADLDERVEDWLAWHCYQERNPAEAKAALEKIIAFTAFPKDCGAGVIVRALALRQSGREAEAGQFFKSWKPEPADAAIAAWAAGVVAGNPSALPATIQDPGCRVLDAWLREAKKP